MVVLDASVLLLLIDPNAKPPQDPNTRKPVEKCPERIRHLLEELSQGRQKVIIPAPALAEFLVRAGKAGPEYLQAIHESAAMKVEPFNERAAVECSQLIATKRAAGKSANAETWAKVKFDRQILAIAKVIGAHTIYTCDGDLAKLANQHGLKALSVYELPLPPVKAQGDLPLNDPNGDA